MPTQAIAAYGTQLRLSDGVALAPLTITNATATAPILITTSTPHGIVDVSYVNVSGVVGAVGANGSWVAATVSPTTLYLRGSASAAAYVSGGTLIRRGTFTNVAELVNITPIGVSFNMVDASAHDGSGWGTSIPTLKRGVDARVEVNLVPAHPTHDETTGFIGLGLNKVRRDWLIVLPDANKTTVAFQAWVSDQGTVTPIEGVLRANPVLSIDGKMSWSYA